jgi:LysM repeat protein
VALFTLLDMTSGAPAWRLFLFLFLAFSFVGCSQLKRGNADDEKDPHVMEGKRRLAGRDWDGAIESFERALQSNPNNAAAHRELGILYYEHKNDYPAAIYHYQRHLKLQPESPMAQVITQHIHFSKQELAKTDSYTPVPRDVQRELEKLSMTNDVLRKRVEFLEAQLSRGPQYITNYVTNYVKLPQFEHGGTRSLTQPAQIVDRPAEEESAPREAAAPDSTRRETTQAARGNRDDGRQSRGSAARNTPSTTVRKAETPVTKTATVHTVRPGETMDVLARKYGVSVADLRAANPGSARGVRSGQKINIPAK